MQVRSGGATRRIFLGVGFEFPAASGRPGVGAPGKFESAPPASANDLPGKRFEVLP